MHSNTDTRQPVVTPRKRPMVSYARATCCTREHLAGGEARDKRGEVVAMVGSQI